MEHLDQTEGRILFENGLENSGGVSEWLYLGTLYSGGEAELRMILEIPKDFGNEFREQMGIWSWEWMAEEFPIEESDPKPPFTGDSSYMLFWTLAVLGSAGILALQIRLFSKRKSRKRKEGI